LKKILVLFFSLTPVVSISSAIFASGPSGCGWDSKVWEGKSEVLAHVCAATTNGISGNQTFGITNGTAGCNEVVKNIQNVING